MTSRRLFLFVLLIIMVSTLYAESYEEKIAKIRSENMGLKQDLYTQQKVNTIMFIVLVMLSLVCLTKF